MVVWDGAHGPERERCEHLADGSSARVTLGSELHSAQNTGLSSQVLEAERGQGGENLCNSGATAKPTS